MLMDTAGGGDDYESGGCHHEQLPLKQNSSKNNDHQNHHSIASKIIIRGTMFFIAFASACVVLYITFGPNQFYLPISNNQLSSQSQETTKSIHCSLPPDIVKIFASALYNSSTPVHARKNDPLIGNSSAVSNTSSPIHALTDELLQGNSSPVSVPKNESLPGNSSPVSISSAVMHGPENLPSPVNQESEEARLRRTLSKAAMGNKTVIVTTVNAAWAAPNSLFDLFLESFRIGIDTQKFLKHLVVIALDHKAYSRCLDLHPHCFALTTEGVDFSADQVFYMTNNYVKLVWRKIEFMYTILQLGYNSIFTDADMLWFRDPFPHFQLDADIQVSCDHYKGTPSNGSANTGFYYVKSNSQTIQFYKFWLASRDKFPRDHDQNIFNKIRSDPFINEIGIQIRLLDTTFYGGFCEPSKDLNLVCTMHTNCCFGLDNKLHDLKKLIEIWKNYMALPSEEKTSKPQNWTVSPRKCR